MSTPSHNHQPTPQTTPWTPPRTQLPSRPFSDTDTQTANAAPQLLYSRPFFDPSTQPEASPDIQTQPDPERRRQLDEKFDLTKIDLFAGAKTPLEPPPSMGVVQRQPTANQLDADAEIESEPQEESGESLQRQCADCAAEDGAGDEDKPPIQAKLTIGQPNDPYEQEADWVAEGVVNWLNAPKPAVGMAGGVGAIAQPQPIQTKSLVQRQEAKPSSEPENGGLKNTKSEGGNWLTNWRQRILTNEQLYQWAQTGSDFFGAFSRGVGLDVQKWIYGDLPTENEHAAVVGEITGMIAGTIATGGSSRVAQAVGMIIDIAGRGEQAYAALEAIKNRDYGKLVQIVLEVLAEEALGRLGGGDRQLGMTSAGPTGANISGPALPGQSSLPPGRPSPRQSELDVEADLVRPGGTGQAQDSYLGGSPVSYGTAGSSRPDIVIRLNGQRVAIEVKNYDLTDSGNRRNLYRVLGEQAQSRAANLPSGTFQGVILDIRGQVIDPSVRQRIPTNIENATGGLIRAQDVRFLE